MFCVFGSSSIPSAAQGHLGKKHSFTIDDLRKSKGLHSISAYGHGAVYIYMTMPAGVAQSRHAFVGGTVSTWAI